MIYFELFLNFLKIGLFTFGGGYAMIPLIKETVLNYGWITEEELLNFIAVAESTPGPIAVNMATFIGSSQGGLLGSFLATLGVILPSFIIIYLICTILKNLLTHKPVLATLNGIKPIIVALITTTGLTMLLSHIFNIQTINSIFKFDWIGLLILAIITIIAITYRRLKKKDLSPILLILISGVLGIIGYGIF